MTLLKETLAYLRKSFWILLLGAIVSSIIISFFARSFSSITSLPTLFIGKTDYDFTDIITLFLTPINKANFWVVLVGYIVYFVFLLIGIVINISIIEKHLKTGSLSLNLSGHQIRAYILPVLFTLAIWSVLYLVSLVAQSGLISLIHYICGVTPPSVIDCILSVIVSVLIYAGLIYVAIHLMLVPLVMVNYGYGFGECLIEPIRLASHNTKPLFFGLAIPFAVFIFSNLLLNYLTAYIFGAGLISEVAHYWLDFVISVITHSLIIVYLSAYGSVSFYSLEGLERRDIMKYQRRK